MSFYDAACNIDPNDFNSNCWYAEKVTTKEQFVFVRMAWDPELKADCFLPEESFMLLLFFHYAFEE